MADLYTGIIFDGDLALCNENYMFTYRGVPVYNNTGRNICASQIYTMLKRIDERFATPIFVSRDPLDGDICVEEIRKPKLADYVMIDMLLPGEALGITYLSKDMQITDEELKNIWLTPADFVLSGDGINMRARFGD